MLWPLAMVLAAKKMDTIDWCVFVLAIICIPPSIWALFRWWRKSQKKNLPRDWQSFWMITIGLVCMIAIVLWYYFRFIIKKH